MSLNSLISYISNSQIITELVKRIKHNNELNIIGSSRYAKSIIINSIAKKENKDILIISPNEEIAYKWYGYFDSIDNKNVLYYPPSENLPYASINKSKETEYSQLSVISKIIKKERQDINIIITTERSLQPHLIKENIFKDNIISLFKGRELDIKELTTKLVLLGYSKENMTSQEGSWSRRGEIIDIFWSSPRKESTDTLDKRIFAKRIKILRDWEEGSSSQADWLMNNGSKLFLRGKSSLTTWKSSPY